MSDTRTLYYEAEDLLSSLEGRRVAMQYASDLNVAGFFRLSLLITKARARRDRRRAALVSLYRSRKQPKPAPMVQQAISEHGFAILTIPYQIAYLAREKG